MALQPKAQSSTRNGHDLWKREVICKAPPRPRTRVSVGGWVAVALCLVEFQVGCVGYLYSKKIKIRTVPNKDYHITVKLMFLAFFLAFSAVFKSSREIAGSVYFKVELIF